MKKYCLDMTVTDVEHPHSRYVLIKLTHSVPLPPMLPGQFVQVRVDGSPQTFLRRPISVNYVDYATNELWLLIQTVGDGTRKLAEARRGDVINLLLPLGNGFSMPSEPSERLLLIGGGVGTAPLLFFGQRLSESGFRPTFLLGARSSADLLETEMFSRLGALYTSTEDGSAGEKGFVTQNSILQSSQFDRIYSCGPKPMMMAVARYAHANGITCEVSLENMMACGLGACLCCVEKTVAGNVCVCKEGPVFNINQLLWQI
jgi:dihydroorotate dehydrogenase electron transfer subunit